MEFAFSCAVSSVMARGAIRHLIHRLKYQGASWTARPLGDLAVRGLGDPRLELLKSPCLVPVPLHPVRRRERGYNQAELIARQISKSSGIPVIHGLVRHRATTTQTAFSRKQRLSNLSGAFRCKARLSLQDRTVILVDDVLTTGSTLHECASTLQDAAPDAVFGLTVARG